MHKDEPALQNIRKKSQPVLKDIPITPENKCSFCTGSICCTYITQKIKAPHTKLDFSNLLWMVSHENVALYKDEEGWSLLIDGKCSHLQANGHCGIYDTRPQACRDYSNDYCEFDAPPIEASKKYFPDYDSLLAYCRKKFKNWDGKDSKKDKKKKKK